MNTSSTPSPEATTESGTHLLDGIRTLRASVGVGLNDDEFTRLLERTPPPTEAGFAFLSFSDGFVTLTVPPQNLANWYPEKGWIVPEKERVARAIADKHELTLCEPPDEIPSSLFPGPESPDLHHHLELSNRWETVVVAHPYFLKIRLYGATSAILYARTAQSPLRLSTELLPDLAALYQA
jgi:hypothetical protein